MAIEQEPPAFLPLASPQPREAAPCRHLGSDTLNLQERIPKVLMCTRNDHEKTRDIKLTRQWEKPFPEDF